MTSIGFIGLGSMGRTMAQRLLESGFDVGVWNRSPAAADTLVQAGARRFDEAEEAFDCDIVVSMLANDAAVSAVFSEDLLARHPGALHVNMASISLAAAREIAARHDAAGVRYLAAPVLGRPNVAAAGQLNILAGGNADHVAAAAPALEVLGKKIWHLGDEPTSANLAKIGVNYNIIHALGALGESVNLVERGGVDPELFIELLTDASFSGIVYKTYGGIIAQRDYFPAAFNAQLGLKDLGLTEDAAAELGAALPVAPALHELFTAAVTDETRRDGDWSIIAEVIRES
ncbi:MAG: NAD(P)-dependent oxidoreductase [Leucobacter sp.]